MEFGSNIISSVLNDSRVPFMRKNPIWPLFFVMATMSAKNSKTIGKSGVRRGGQVGALAPPWKIDNEKQ